MRYTTGTITKAVLSIMLLSTVSRGLGLIRESVLAACYGASVQSDTYKIALDIPGMLLTVISMVIATTLIPVYSDYLKSGKQENALYFLNNILNIIILVSMALAISGIIFAPILVRAIVPGFSAEAYKLTVRLTVIMLPSLVFSALNSVADGYLQAEKRFTVSAFSGIPYNALIIASILLFWSTGIEAAAIGTLLAVAVQLLVMVCSMRRAGFRYKPVLNFSEQGLRKIVTLSAPVLLGYGFNLAYTIISRIVVSGLGKGSLSMLDYANKVNGIVSSVFIIPIITVIFPRLSLISDRINELSDEFAKAARAIIFITLPMMAAIIVLKTQIIDILFQRGAFGLHETHITSMILGLLAIGMMGDGIAGLLAKVFFSLKDTKTPVIYGIITACTNMVMCVILARLFDVYGVAASLALSALLSGILLTIKLKRRIGHIGGRKIAASMGQALTAALIMALFLNIIRILLLDSVYSAGALPVKALVLVFSFLSGAVIYMGMLYIFKIEELRAVKKYLKIEAQKITWKGFIQRIPVGVINTNTVSDVRRDPSMQRFAVILAGGSGSRLWPLSRQTVPKQLRNISGKDIMLNETIQRAADIVGMQNILIVAGVQHRDAVNRYIITGFPRENILYEPESRNTSASIAYAAITIAARSRDAVMCVLPSDHHISNEPGFRDVVNKAFGAAEKTDGLITIGIEPSYPAVGYGYIRRSNGFHAGFEGVYDVHEFIEKPDLDRARKYISTGDYLWNSGIFFWKVSVIQRNLQRFLPRLFKPFKEVTGFIGSKGEYAAIERIYEGLQNISIDYGVLERSENVLVIPGDFGWSDIGSWDAIGMIFPPDQDGNIVRAKHVCADTVNSIIYSDNGLIATVGLENMIVVRSEDAVLICPRDRSQEVKNIVDKLKKDHLEGYL